MAYLLRQGGKVDYNYKEYYLDTEEELSEIDVNNCCPGSIAFIITTGKVFMLTNKKEWVAQ